MNYNNQPATKIRLETTEKVVSTEMKRKTQLCEMFDMDDIVQHVQ